jgi:hypothetical protein
VIMPDLCRLEMILWWPRGPVWFQKRACAADSASQDRRRTRHARDAVHPEPQPQDHLLSDECPAVGMAGRRPTCGERDADRDSSTAAKEGDSHTAEV